MASVVIDGNTYILPLGDVYIGYFENVVDDCIVFDELDIESNYKKMDKLFGFVANSLCMMDESEGYPDELLDEKLNIRKRIDSVDRLQKYFYKNGNVEKSISMIKDFLIVMLVHNQKLMDFDKKERRV